MFQIIRADGAAEQEFLRALSARNTETDARVTESVSAILRNVREKGDAAVREYTERFDGIALDRFVLTKEEIEEGYQACDPELRRVLERAARNIRAFHERQRQQSWQMGDGVNTLMGQRIMGLAKVGLYVPGGTAAYPSSVLMNAIPAKVAEVGELVMVTPPGKDGKIAPHILAAAKIAGVDTICRIGGAQAVGALAYGTEQIPKVDKIVGPGNIFVATAKKLVFGTVDIDMIAGPSEILIIADESANPAYVAADMMSQAEHDKMASSTLLCLSEEFARKVQQVLAEQLEHLSRKEIITASLRDFGAAIVCGSLEQAAEISDAVAPEHLELMVEQPLELLKQVRNAGSVFLGKYAPEPLGDYMAGPNHVLPTGGTARFFSPLSYDAFIKKSSFLYYGEEALRGIGADVMTFAESEGLTAHANSIRVRMK